jgi:hypothetical protein
MDEAKMSRWSKDELMKIAQSDDLHVSPFGPLIS